MTLHSAKSWLLSTAAGVAVIFGLLTIVFITLKLTGYIDWSWWWVLSPIWAALLIVALVFVGAMIFFWRR